ncbi:hypothetical protein FQZ97_1209990 [compost metagenome]
MNKIAIAEAVCLHMPVAYPISARTSNVCVGQVARDGSAEGQIVDLPKQLLQNWVCIHKSATDK